MVTESKTEKRLEPSCIFCRRLQIERDLVEHLECPYCYGTSGEVASGNHARFCSFEPGKDPLLFGFPKDFGRYRSS